MNKVTQRRARELKEVMAKLLANFDGDYRETVINRITALGFAKLSETTPLLRITIGGTTVIVDDITLITEEESKPKEKEGN